MSDSRERVISSLTDWIERVVRAKEMATPEEIATLPAVAEVLLAYYSSVSSLPLVR